MEKQGSYVKITSSEYKEAQREKLNFRDEIFSRRHRESGPDCPMIDIDFLAIEYGSNKATALIEYKHETIMAGTKFLEHLRTKSVYKAMADLGNRACLPAFCSVYSNDISEYTVFYLN